ncbi:tRNA pseudouridine synthase D [Meredithblackwellia eburnea MCA 4105]
MSEHGHRPAKKQKIDSQSLSPNSDTDSDLFANETTGLFALLKHHIGKRTSTEDEVGIHEYVDNSVPSFKGIIKHRFTDFLVNEVGLDGNVLHLKNVNPPPRQPQNQSSPANPRAAEQTEPEGDAREPKPLWNDESMAAAKLFLGAQSDEDENFIEFKKFVLAGKPEKSARNKVEESKGENDGTTSTRPVVRVFTTKAIESKDSRTAIHRGLREAFNSAFTSETRELPSGEQFIDVKWANDSGNNQKGRGAKGPRPPPEAQHPPYIHFTLQKTNKEMHDALSSLARSLKVNNREIGTAGTKDKRAVTVQRVSIRRGRKTVEDIWKALSAHAGGGGGGRGGRGRGRGRGGWNNGGGGYQDRQVRIGDVEYAEKGLELGQLKGNRFVVTLRDVEYPTPTTIPQALSVLSERGFLNYYGMQRFGTAPVPTHAIGLALLRSDWALASRLLLLVHREGEGEDVQIARTLWREGKFEEGARQMPRRCVAEKALMEHYLRCDKTDHLSAIGRIPKNLRMMYVHAYQSYVWNQVVSARVATFGSHGPVEGDLVYEDGENPIEEDEGEGSGEAVEEVAVAEGLDPVLEEVLPTLTEIIQPGQMTSSLATQTSKVPKVKVLTKADIESGKYSIKDVVLPLPGFAVTYPTGKLGEMYSEIMSNDGLERDDMFRKQKEYSMGGTYRAMLYTPKDVSYKILLYTSPAQDLAQSDEDILLNVPAPPVVEFDPTQSATVPEGQHLALQIELTLGAGTFCTMALREVLKSRTASAHQKDLTKEMEERVKAEGGATAEASVDADVQPVVDGLSQNTAVQVDQADGESL